MIALVNYIVAMFGFFCGGVMFGNYLAYRNIKRKLKPPTPHPMQQIFEQLKKSGIPFQVIQDENCNCPACSARREMEKPQRGGNDALH